jgi:hypothetical protein
MAVKALVLPWKDFFDKVFSICIPIKAEGSLYRDE